VGFEHTSLLLPTKVQRLSRGNDLACVFELRDEAQWVLTIHEHEFAQVLADDERVANLAHLSGDFVYLNEINTKMEARMKIFSGE
jgi:hypothetical protein